ncbi:hypothetical protein ADUPG1_003826 [Aduncisulcus paluster]|uniref:Uncharacterized protein n=1 Tax=Aduncisulcus paluster TaxID=2918883 RepID=A0ABQ5L1P8_9EUKA|nr:hypothetical protein ADUPG1_003826 [Aduncisulcus paluster]
MKRVIVSYEDKVVMEETLDKALAVIFGIAEEDSGPSGGDSGSGTSGGGNADAEVQELLDQINDLFKASEDNMDELRDLIQQLNTTLNEEPESGSGDDGTPETDTPDEGDQGE